MDELLPCPFCGSQPELDDPDSVHPVTRMDKDDRQVWRAGCTNYLCSAAVTGWTREEAITNWNKRV